MRTKFHFLCRSLYRFLLHPQPPNLLRENNTSGSMRRLSIICWLRCQHAAVLHRVTSHHHELEKRRLPSDPPLIALHNFAPLELERLSHLQQLRAQRNCRSPQPSDPRSQSHATVATHPANPSFALAQGPSDISAVFVRYETTASAELPRSSPSYHPRQHSLLSTARSSRSGIDTAGGLEPQHLL